MLSSALSVMRNSFRLIAFSVMINLMTAGSASAHPSGLQAGDPWWRAWHWDSLVVLNLALLSLLYCRGLIRIWRRAGVGRAIPVWRAGAFLLGILALIAALLSPLDTLSEDLSWVHMTQHMVLMVLAAPLIVIGVPGLALTWSLPKSLRGPFGRFLTGTAGRSRRTLHFLLWNPMFLWTVHALCIWIWHLPYLYEWALQDPLIHDIEHLTFFIAACLFWRVSLDVRVQPTLNPAASVLYLFTTSLHMMTLGVLMALSPTAWYKVYIGRTEGWGLSPLEDQQLAGLIMWMPGCIVYAIVAAALFARWLDQADRATSLARPT